MANHLSQNELVFLKPATDDGLALFAGSVKVNLGDAGDYSRAVRLLSLPEFEITNSANQSRGSGLVVSNPEFYPVVCQTVLDKSVPKAFNVCVTGACLGDMNIYHVMATGTNATALKTITLTNTFLAKWQFNYDASTDQMLGDGVIATYTFICSAITQVRSQFDASLTATGKVGVQADRLRQTAQTTS